MTSAAAAPLFPGRATPEGRLAEYLQVRYGDRAEELAVVPLSGDASTRRYFRVHDGSETRVLSLYPEPFQPAELSFVVVGELLAGYGLPVPAVLDHDGPRGLVVLEDLGDLTLQEALRSASAAERGELYRQALDQLACLQRQAQCGPQRAACFQIAFDFENLSWELHYFLKHFVEGHRGCDLTAEDRAALAEGFHHLSQEIASWPRVLCHRDFHSRNLMLRGRALFWIDFQDARLGPATYDLVSLLRDSYVELPEEFVAEQAEAFREQAVPGETRAAFQRRFDLMSVQRNLKALGTFGFMASVRGNDVYLPYIPHTLRSARRNLARYPELANVWRALARHVPELA
jgi:aminoglycoside/choline kinase family phosphotransferase